MASIMALVDLVRYSPLHTAYEGTKHMSDEQTCVFCARNKHAAAMGRPPEIDANTPRRYTAVTTQRERIRQQTFQQRREQYLQAALLFRVKTLEISPLFS